MDTAKKPRRAKAEAPVTTDECDAVAAAAPLSLPEGASEGSGVAVLAAPAKPATAAAVATPSSSHAQPKGAGQAAVAEDDEFDEFLQRGPQAPRDTPLSVRLSHQLHSRLLRTAQEEGVTIEALVQELLAEGVTLRAWEILERKAAMRGGAPNGNSVGPGPRDGGGPRNFNQNSNYGNNGRAGSRNAPASGGGNGNGPRSGSPNHRGNRPPTNNAWMEDKAAFLEYVRNQEKRRR